MNPFSIKSLACQLPQISYSNNDEKFKQVKDISPGWHSFWGVKQRPHIDPSLGENEVVLAERAALEALELAEIKATDLDLILSNYTCPAINDNKNIGNHREILPRMGDRIRDRIGATKAICWDTELECLSFLMNLQLAQGLIAQGVFKKILVCSSERLSSTADFTTKWSTIFSDGAAAAVVTEEDSGFKFLGSHWGTNSTYYDLGLCKWREPFYPDKEHTEPQFDMYVTMAESGDQTMKLFVPQAVPAAIHTAISKAGLTLEDINYFVFHQPSSTLVSAWAQGVELKEGSYLRTVEEVGCLGSVATPYTLYTALKQGAVKENDIVSFAGACTGWSFMSSLWQLGNIRISA
ncbi:3-oxoacyl-ACP synthase III family protein [Aliikangiella sp. IMCC44359]|uniref:3-oxoacyl-ACP synthase III family protein n=1 Tax=Aliikangiella sp. IMCC44359 TaxID=3459125 RepID=UPI00403AAC17